MKNFKRNLAIVMSAAILSTAFSVGLPVQTASAASTKVISITAKKAPTISSIANLTKTVELYATVTMPETVTGTMSDKTKKQAAVKWDKELSARAVGSFTAKGTVVGYSKKVVFKLTVKAPKVGTIDIPKVTDDTLKMPTEVKFGMRADTFYEGSDLLTVDNTMPSVQWKQNAPEADFYIIRMYDQYKQQLIHTYYGIGMNNFSKPGYYDFIWDEFANIPNIRTITITPVNSVDGRAGANESDDKVGETAVFECSMDINIKKSKPVKVTSTPNTNNTKKVILTFSEKLVSYESFALSTEYIYETKKGVKKSDSASDYDRAEKDGTVSMYMDANRYKEKYANKTSKVRLLTFGEAKITDDKTASYTINISPVTLK